VEYYQVECPADKSRQIVEVTEVEGRNRIDWCSQRVGCPDCSQSCLKSLRSVAFLMVTDLPQFESEELKALTLDQILARFESTELERLPVTEDGALKGSLCLRRLAFWRDDREVRSGLNMSDWSSTASEFEPLNWVELEETTVQLKDSWDVAIEKMPAVHRNELFVVGADNELLGCVYARQLLRACYTEPERP